MVPVIRISEDNFERLQKWATPLVDSVDDALGKALDAAEFQKKDMSGPLAPSPTLDDPFKERAVPAANQSNGSTHSRLPRGKKVQNKAYERPILEAIYELGGRGRMGEVLDIVERKMSHLFSSVDYEMNPNGTDRRWRNTAQWVRYSLVKRGFLKEKSGHGIWELTDKGVAEVEGTIA